MKPASLLQSGSRLLFAGLLFGCLGAAVGQNASPANSKTEKTPPPKVASPKTTAEKTAAEKTAIGATAPAPEKTATGQTPEKPSAKKETSRNQASDNTGLNLKGKLTPLNKQETVFLDLEGKRLLLKSRVCLRKGVLELLCCLKQSKEHEAILSLESKAYVVHAGLLALGAEAGQPVQFDPEFKPASGQKIDIFVNWNDPDGTPHRVPAQDWVRYVTLRFYAEKLAKLPEEVKITGRLDEMRYDPKEAELIWYGPMTEEMKKKLLAMSKDKAYQACIEKFFQRSQSRRMGVDWVFSGSGYYVDEQTKEKFYRAEDGDLICVANFGSATIDVATRSGNGADELMFEAWTERIPEIGTQVMIELVPSFDNPGKAAPPATPKSGATGEKAPAPGLENGNAAVEGVKAKADGQAKQTGSAADTAPQ